MFSSLSWLFNHYCDHHFAVSQTGFPIIDGDGTQMGHVDRICFGRTSLRVEGWSTADKVALGPPSRLTWQKPDIKRPDVNVALEFEASKGTGFNLAWFGPLTNVMLSLKSDATTLQIMCPTVGRWAMFKAKAHIRVSFAKSVLRSLPSLTRAYLNPSSLNKSLAKRALGMRDEQLNHILDARVFDQAKQAKSVEKITLIMPVYNAFGVLCEALDRIAENTDVPWCLVLIEDCSSDERVRPMLREWSARQRALGIEIELLENQKNLGFIGSVNRAFKEALKFDDHVVLINSDALVPARWAQRLLHPILKDSRVASVTPFSNDAEIFNVPTICQRLDLEPGEGDQIDACLAANISSNAYKSAPTGVGFCMAINRKFLRKVPEFDSAFGKGYGEEVDWCQQTAAFGGQHVVQSNLFVEHRGGASFGSLEKQKSIARNNQIISRRYPKFDQSVQRFIATDPVKTSRIFAACASLSARQKGVNIYIAHSLGGGAEAYLREKIQRKNDCNEGVIVLRVGGPMRWRIEVHAPSGIVSGDTDDDALMLRMLAAVSNAHVIYSCAVGDFDPVTLPKIILEIVQTKKADFTVLVHDFFAISPSYCLLDSDNIYRPLELGSYFDRAHTSVDRKGTPVSPVQWRARWFTLLESATHIECFSQSSADILATAFPKLSSSISIVPHQISNVGTVRASSFNTAGSIGVLGDIGLQKGAQCVKALSNVLPSGQFRNLVVVGRMDPRFTLGENSIETGAYKRSDIAALAERHNITAWLIPSIWPETFSYTTHEALATGLPVFCFDLGAQEEAVRAAQNGHVLPLNWADKPNLILANLTKVIDDDKTRGRFHSSAEENGYRSFAAQSKSAS